MVKKFLFLWTFVLSLIGCSNDKNSKKVIESIPNSNLTVFIKNLESSSPISVFKAPYINNLKDHYVSNTEYDTLIIPINQYDEIYFSSGVTFRDTLIVKWGDTLNLDFNNNLLDHKLKKSRCREEINKKLDDILLSTNIDSLKNIVFTLNKSLPLEISNDYEKLKPIYPQSADRTISKSEIKKIVELSVKNFLTTTKKIDSLLKTQFEFKELGALKKNLLRKKLYGFISNLNRYYGFEFFRDYLSSDIFINNSIENSVEEPYILKLFIQQVILNGEKDFSRSKLYIDYRKAYDLLPDFLEGELLKHARYICIRQMYNLSEGFLSIQEYSKNFKESYKGDTLVAILNKNFLTEFKDLENSDFKLQLVNNKLEQISLKEILAMNKGKIVYIDFWASWCAPCRAVMPESRILKNEYKNENFAILYISIDTDITQWKNAVKTEDLENYENSYLMTNSLNASFLRNLNFKTIPRYLVFNKNGILIHDNAPGPSGNEIRALINQNLADDKINK